MRIEDDVSNEWYTPSKYIEAAREVMGSIDVDPASCVMANEIVRASKYYTQSNDGLLFPWQGNIWLNPPYSETEKWTSKMVCEYEQGDVKQAIILINACTDTQWFQQLLVDRCCLVRGRIKFIHPDKEYVQPRFPSIFIYLGPKEEKFREVFKQFGRIVRVID